MDRGAWWAAVRGVTKESNTTDIIKQQQQIVCHFRERKDFPPTNPALTDILTIVSSSLLSLHTSFLPVSFLHLFSPFLSVFVFQNFKSLLFTSHIVKSLAYEMNKSESYIDKGPAGYLEKRELQPRVISDLMVEAVWTRRDPWPSQKMVRDTSNRKGCSSWFFFFFFF